MKSRHFAREVALQILYREDVLRMQALSEGAVQAGQTAQVSATDGETGSQINHSRSDPRPDDLAASLKHHFAHFNVPPELQPFVTALVSCTLQNLQTLDELLEKHAEKWKVSRMGFVDRNLLRLAAAEMLHGTDATPPKVVIDEAVELAKQFGTEETPPFVNAILDSIWKERLEK